MSILKVLTICLAVVTVVASFEFENANSTQLEDTDDAYEPPRRYDDTQLWRIHNISKEMQENVSQTLENEFDGIIWNQNSQFLDISIDKVQLEATRNYLTANQLNNEVLNKNVQQLIDEENSSGATRSKRATTSGMNWESYHDLETIYAFMTEIRDRHPDIATLYTIGKSVEGRDLKVLRISENPTAYKKIWIDGGIHAREWISSAAVTYILNQMMANWENQPDYIRNRTWYIMPVMNPDGYVYSRNTDRFWRKNRASPPSGSNCYGVDLNRNFDIAWSVAGSSTDPCIDVYRGKSAASEPETQAVAKFLRNNKQNLRAYLTYHSYGQLIVYPWGCKADKPADAATLRTVANRAVQRIKRNTGTAYTANGVYNVFGITGGASDDWAKSIGIKYVYTMELRDTGSYGFLIPVDQIVSTAEEANILARTVAQVV